MLQTHLFEIQRNALTERSVSGAILIVHGQEIIDQFGADDLYYPRSLMKPYQMRAIQSYLAPILNSEQRSLSVSSHQGSDQHLQVVRSMDDHTQDSLIIPLTHPCSGKHSAILRACQINHWSLGDYHLPTHPYFKIYLNEVKKVLGEEWNFERLAVDGCGLPTFSMKLSEMAILMSALTQNQEQDWIWDAYIKHPVLIGGEKQIDTLIIQSLDHTLAKIGADGLLGISMKHPKFPKGLGIIIKLHQGSDPLLMHWAAFFTLKQMGLKIASPAEFDGQTIQVGFKLNVKV